MKTIAVVNQKGGVGKTTTSVNLSAYAAKSGLRVLIVDLDPQGNATSGLGLDKYNLSKGTLYDVLVMGQSISSICLSTKTKNIDILPSNNDLSGAEVELVATDQRERKLERALVGAGESYDLCVIDCPPSLGLLSVNGLVAADYALVPVQTEYYAMEGVGQLVQTVQAIQASLNPDLTIVGVLLTMYDSRNSLSSQVKSELERVFGDIVLSTVIPRNVRLAEAPSYGESILAYDKWSKGARSYKAVTKEILKRIGIV